MKSGVQPGLQICVYCASSAQAPRHFLEAAYRLGRALAQAGAATIYGGGALGSMGALADGVLDCGGRIIGVMPRFMRDLEWAHPRVTEFVWTEAMHDRKQRLFENADAIVALPGGCGTWEELLEVVTLKRLGIFLKPILIVNQLGFYDPLIQLLDRAVSEKFMDDRHRDLWTVVESVDQVLGAIAAAPEWAATAREFAVPK